MGRDPWPEFSVQIQHRRLRCVADAQLCFLRDGAAFLGGLIPYADVLATPEFLRVLDDWEIHDGSPNLLGEALGEGYSNEEIRDALRLWLRLRDESGIRGGRLYWVRDSVRESSLPPGTDDSLILRWEAMAEALEGRLSSTGAGSNPIVAHRRDAVALVAAMPGTLLLTVRGPTERASSSGRRKPAVPSLCQHLEAWGLPCRRIEIEDDLVALERNLLLHMLVEAGLSGFLWHGLPLSVVHLVVPGNFGVTPGQYFAGGTTEVEYGSSGEPRPVKSPWEAARAFWYDLSSGGYHAAT